MTLLRNLRWMCQWFAGAGMAALLCATSAAQTSFSPGSPQIHQEPETAGGPTCLRQASRGLAEIDERALGTANAGPAAVPGKFEKFLLLQAGPETEIRRLAAELLSGSSDGWDADLSPLVPSDYALAAGDEVLVTARGSVDAGSRQVVDRSRRIGIPRFGTLPVSSVRHAELAGAVNLRVSQGFRNFQSSVTPGQLRGFLMFVTSVVETNKAIFVQSAKEWTQILFQFGLRIAGNQRAVR